MEIIGQQSVLSLDLTKEIKKIQTFKVKQFDEFDGFLISILNKIYDTYEYVLEYKQPSTIKSIIRAQYEIIISDLIRIKTQTTELMDLLKKTEYESKNMDRLQSKLRVIKNEIPKLLKKLMYKLSFQEMARLGMEQLAKQRPITLEIALAQVQRLKSRRNTKNRGID